jgi:putative motility protein YjfB-like
VRLDKRELKFSWKHPLWRYMNISNAPTSLLDSVLTAQTTRQDIGVDVLKKAQDAMKSQGEAMVQMLEKSAVPVTDASHPVLDAYA